MKVDFWTLEPSLGGVSYPSVDAAVRGRAETLHHKKTGCAPCLWLVFPAECGYTRDFSRFKNGR